VAVAVAALVLAAIAIAIAIGVSLGRDGDRQNEYFYRQQMDETLGNLTNRVKALEPEEEDDDERA
jgi:hypothetical protein